MAQTILSGPALFVNCIQHLVDLLFFYHLTWSARLDSAIV